MCKNNKNTEITLCLRNPCNYRCDYCIGHREQHPVVLHDLNRLSSIYSSINPFILTVFECGAGEPTIHPQIKEILSLCKKYGSISMPTNNSIEPNKWLLKEYAKALFLNITVHPQAEKELDSFSDRLSEIKELGSTINLGYITRPDKINKLFYLKEYFNKKGFKIKGVPFTGVFEGKKYPGSYTEVEKENLGINDKTYWLTKLSANIKARDFKGIPCLAGITLFCVTSDTILKRCLYDETPMDAPYEEAQPCIVSHCGCYLVLKELNSQTPNYWNTVRKLSGYSLLETSGKTEDQLYQESYSIYQDLMRRYNKI